jgi:hypothetical protein
MKSGMRVFALALLFVLGGCASGGSSKTEVTTAPGAELPAYATFVVESSAAPVGGTNPPLSIADANVRNAIRSRLAQKGYREAAQEPDLVIRFETAPYVVEKVTSPVRIGLGVGSFGGPVGVGVGTSAPVGGGKVEGAAQTKLTIRAIDPSANQELWVGTTTGLKPEHLDATGADAAVAETLADFPARPD